jgi:Spy/CpxP family protein refolding chaperone
MNSSNQPRRRFFKRAAIAGLLGAAAAGIGLKAHAHGGWHRRGFMDEPLDPAKLDERLDRMLKHLYVEIDATDAQKEKLGPIVKDAVKELRPLREKMRTARKQAIELLTKDNVDRAAIEKLRAEQMQAAEQASKRVTRALADAAEVLTPAQRKQVAERIGRRWGHRG